MSQRVGVSTAPRSLTVVVIAAYVGVSVTAYRYPARKSTGARAADTTPHHGIAARGTSRTGAGALAGMPWGWLTLEVTLLRYLPSPLTRTTG